MRRWGSEFAVFLANHDIHEGRSESGGIYRPKDVMHRWGSESEVFLANRDIHEGRSKSGCFYRPKDVMR
ncbi:hypothetical protein ACSBR1_014540 [Camellia fascicularis]